jgi:Ca2+-binding RTX toxin-like protein
VGTDATSLLDQAKGGKMRKVTLMLAAVAMMVSLFAVVAYAAEITGTGNSDDLYESNRNDTIFGHRGDDEIFARRFEGDKDVVNGNRNDDYINVADGDGLDTADGGLGQFDTCIADSGDDVIDCEAEPAP